MVAPLPALATLRIIALVADNVPWTTLIIVALGSWAFSLVIGAVRLNRRRD
jgi:hypothetical protein